MHIWGKNAVFAADVWLYQNPKPACQHFLMPAASNETRIEAPTAPVNASRPVFLEACSNTLTTRASYKMIKVQTN